MKRGPPGYTDTNSNSYSASQRQPMTAQRMQQNPIANNYTGRSDSFPVEEERQYAPEKAEGQWQWEMDAQQMSPQLYSDGQGGYDSKSLYSTTMSDIKLGSNQESRVLPQEQDMEVGYEDNPSSQTLAAIEQKFRDDIMKLTKDQIDTEDAENARHREKIIEINNQHQEKLTVLRARHATRQEDFLRKESQARLHQYQLAGVGPHQNNSVPSDTNHGHHGYGEAPRSIPGEPQRQYDSGQFDSYRHPGSLESGRMQGGDTRVPALAAAEFTTRVHAITDQPFCRVHCKPYHVRRSFCCIHVR